MWMEIQAATWVFVHLAAVECSLFFCTSMLLDISFV